MPTATWKKTPSCITRPTVFTDYSEAGLRNQLRNTEYNVELNYGIHVTNWLTVCPNLQYIANPGGATSRQRGG